MYVLGFVAFLALGKWRARQGWRGMEPKDVDDMLLWGVLGVILGGRFGYVLFYKPAYYLAHPLEVFYIWQGGMSFHGGLLGVMAAMWLIARKHHIDYLRLMDFFAPLVPPGLGAGRLGNFING